MFRFSFVLAGLLGCWATLSAQITSTTQQLAEASPYSAADQVFYFADAASISLKSEQTDVANYTLTWSKYDAAAQSWQVVGTSPEISFLTEGGYQLVVQKNDGSEQATYRCWALVPELTGAAVIEKVDHTCDRLTLKASGIVPKALSVVDTQNGKTHAIDYGIGYTWFLNSTAFDAGNSKVSQIEIDAPFTDGDYSVAVGSRFAFVEKSTSPVLNVVAIAVSAAFEYTLDKGDVENEAHTDEKGSAPLRVEFKAEPDGTDKRSKGHITAYTWDFGGAGKDFVANPSFVFQDAKTYEVVLTVENQASGCTDTSEPQSIQVVKLFLDVPNFFTPTGDGTHDEFRVSYRSVKDFRMQIVNRWGRIVYDSTNPAEGWDGKIGGKKAAPGVYFYDITATGFNDGEKEHRKGFLHLITNGK